MSSPVPLLVPLTVPLKVLLTVSVKGWDDPTNTSDPAVFLARLKMISLQLSRGSGCSDAATSDEQKSYGCDRLGPHSGQTLCAPLNSDCAQACSRLRARLRASRERSLRNRRLVVPGGSRRRSSAGLTPTRALSGRLVGKARSEFHPDRRVRRVARLWTTAQVAIRVRTGT